MKFKEFAQFLNELENISSRNEITERLGVFLKKVELNEVKEIMYFLQGRLVPKFIPLEFNFSDKQVIKALESKFKIDIKESYLEIGDIGSTVYELFLIKNKLNESDIEINEIYWKLQELAKISGKGSQELKQDKYLNIIEGLDPISAKFVTRIIVGNLRIGFSEKTILDSFSTMVRGNKSLRDEIDIAYGARSDLGELAELIKININNKEIAEVLKTIKIKPGVPIASKLVEREKDPQSVWERLPKCFVQPKLDGLRGQLHFKKLKGEEKDESILLQAENGIISEIYSRNMESLTDHFPELTKALTEIGVESVILDSEIVGYNERIDKFFTYQETMTRKRKYDVETYSNSIPVRAMCFDILFLNGVDLTMEPIEKRLVLLNEVLSKIKDSPLKILETIQIESEEQLVDYFEREIGKGLEGIIAKGVETVYEPGTRNFKWIKLKANSKSELVDTLDLVVLGFYRGGGSRARFGFGALLAGVYDKNTDTYYSIGKVGSGFKEEEMLKIFEDMDRIKVISKPDNYIVEKSLYPDVWIKPEIIFEVIADEITRSPHHTAGRGIKTNVPREDFNKGLSIRFPRIKRWNRDDKDMPNSVDEILRMYELRKGN